MNFGQDFTSWWKLGLMVLPFIVLFICIQSTIIKGMRNIGELKLSYKAELMKYFGVTLIFIGVFSFYGAGDKSSLARDHEDTGHYKIQQSYSEPPKPKSKPKLNMLKKQNSQSFSQEAKEADDYINSRLNRQ